MLRLFIFIVVCGNEGNLADSGGDKFGRVEFDGTRMEVSNLMDGGVHPRRISVSCRTASIFDCEI